MGALAIREPSSLAEVHDLCDGAERWAEGADSIGELQDLNNKLAAIKVYVEQSSLKGAARIEAARRRIEVRIGQILGPAEMGRPRKSDHDQTFDSDSPLGQGASPAAILDLNDRQRSDFRRMAEHPDVVEETIADSSDDDLPSRRKVVGAIAERQPAAAPAKPKRTPLPDLAKSAGWELRRSVERIERIAADDRFTANRSQVDDHLRAHLIHAAAACQLILDQLDS